MNKKNWMLLCFVLLSSHLFAQKVIEASWDVLQDIDYYEKYVPEVKAKAMFPTFTPDVSSLNGKTVELDGYVIPFDPTGKLIALSANPYSACYFCGKAGPASVMTIKLKDTSKKYRIDAYKKFRGTLRLNADDVHEFFYILDNAEQVNN